MKGRYLLLISFCLSCSAAGAADVSRGPASVKFVSTSYVDETISPYRRTHDIAQYSVQFSSSGFTAEGIVGTRGSPALPEYPCSDKDNLCWISVLPRLIAVYPRRCLPECGAWEAYGFHFEQRYPYHLVIDGKLEPLVLYEVTSPAGEVQVQLVSASYGLVGFTDFYDESRSGSQPVLLRNQLEDGQVFPFDHPRIAEPRYDDETFLQRFGISWSEAQTRSGIAR